MCCVLPRMKQFYFWGCCILEGCSQASNEDLKEYKMIKAIKDFESMWFFKHDLYLQILKMNVTKDKIRKSVPGFYFEKPANMYL